MPFDLETATVQDEVPQSSGGFDLNSATILADDVDETVYRKDTETFLKAPSGFDAQEITMLDDVQNNGESASNFFGFTNVGKAAIDVGVIPPKAAAATAVDIQAKLRAGANLGMADAIDQGFEFSQERINGLFKRSSKGEKLTDEESRIMMREIGNRNFILSFLFESPEEDIEKKVRKAVKKNDTDAIIRYKNTATRLRVSSEKIRESSNKLIKDKLSLDEDANLAEKGLYALSQGATTLGVSLGLTAVTKNPASSAILFSELQESDVYLEARDAGVGTNKARAKAQLAGKVEGALEFVGLHMFFKVVENSKGLTKHFYRMGQEAVQEASQQSAEELITQTSGIREQDIQGAFERIGKSALIGGILGGGSSVAIDVFVKEQSEKEGLPESLVRSFVEKAQSENDVLVETVAQDIEADASPIKIEQDKDNIDVATNIIKDFDQGKPIDLSGLTEKERLEVEATLEKRIPKRSKFGKLIDGFSQKISNIKGEKNEANLKINEARKSLDDVDIDNLTPEEVTALANDIEFSELERDAISIASENQIIELERQQQEQILTEAQNLKDQLDQIPDFTANDKKEVQKELGYKLKSLTDFIKETGGVKDNEGELRARDITNKSLVGLITKNNRTVATAKGKITQDAQVDAVILRAFEAGYFPNKNSVDEVSHSDLYDAIAQDLFGNKIYTLEDRENINDLFEGVSENAEQDFFERGIERGMSVEQIADALRREQGLDTYTERAPIISELDNNKRLKNRVQEIITAKDEQRGLSSGSFLSRNLEKITQSNFVQDFTLGFGEAVAPISMRIKNINPRLFARLRKYEFDVKEQIMQDIESVSPFLRRYRKLDNDTQFAMDLALKNGDVELIDYISKENNMVEEVQAVQDVLQKIFERAEAAGVDVEYRKNYFPRRVKDVDGLIDYFKNGKYWNTVEKAFTNWSDQNIPLTDKSKSELKAYRSKVTKEIKGGEKRRLTQKERDKVSELYFEKKKKMPRRALTKEEKARIINSLVRGFSVGGITISRSGSLKKSRSVENVTADINKFYENPEQTLLAYLNSVNETIETSKLFGKGAVIEGDKQLNIEDSVGAFIEDAVANEQLSNRQTEILKDAFNARFNTGKMGWIAGSIRDLTYIDVMGSPLNAITQFGDLATSMYNAGILNTVSTVGSAAIDRTKVNLRDLTIEDIAQEFDNNNLTSKAVEKVFKSIGLTKIDRVGKLTLVNSTLKKIQKQAKKDDKELLKQLDLYFEGGAQKVLQDLKDGNITDDVKFLMFNTLADFQPVARSEMPQYYLTSGNMKILYILKSFTIKQLDVYRREGIAKINEGIRTGDKKLAVEGLSNFTRLAAFWIVMGVSADYLKDMLRSAFGGDEMDEPEDYVIDNIFKAFGWSRFQQDMIGRDGLSETFFKLFIPPTKSIDNLERDWKKFNKEGLTLENSRTIRSIPIGGELYYFWFGDGSGEEKGKKGKNESKVFIQR